MEDVQVSQVSLRTSRQAAALYFSHALDGQVATADIRVDVIISTENGKCLSQLCFDFLIIPVFIVSAFPF